MPEYLVLTREALPARSGGWNGKLGPVQVKDLAGAADAAVRDAAGDGPFTAVIAFDSGGAQRELAFSLAYELARHTRGAVVELADDGPSRAEDCGDSVSRAVSTSQIEQGWRDLLADSGLA